MPRNFLISIALIYSLNAPFAYAQSVVPDPVQYIVSPENPNPNQLVNIEVSGVGTFLGNSRLTWQENGKTVDASSGQTSFSFTTGGIGTPTKIHLIINSPTQGTITHDFLFNPSVVNLVWEADTYTPLLYQGKPLYSAGSALRVVAFPTIVLGGIVTPINKLSFQWYRDDSLVPASSGLGKNVFSLQGDQLQTSEDVSVVIYSGNASVGKGEIVIPASSPLVLFYNKDPLRGELLDEALSNNVSLQGKEVTVQAEPYFFSNSSKKNSLQYSWTLAGQETTGPDAAEGRLTLRQTGEGAGSADLSVSVQNTATSQYAQSASASLTLLFGQQAGSSISSFFGL